jgi:hypothetical protein
VYYTANAFSQFINPIPGILLIWAAPEHLIWYNLFFVVPSLINSSVVYGMWSKAKATNAVGQVKIIQSYSHLVALKDKAFGTAMQWIPTGDGKAHKSPTYKYMRILCTVWTIIVEGMFIAGSIWRGVDGVIKWYNLMVRGYSSPSLFPRLIMS